MRKAAEKYGIKNEKIRRPEEFGLQKLYKKKIASWNEPNIKITTQTPTTSTPKRVHKLSKCQSKQINNQIKNS